MSTKFLVLGGRFLGLGRGRELNPNIFFSNFSFASGISRQNPGISRQKKFDSLGFEGHTELFGPHPFTWKTPTPPEISGLKSLGLGSFFVPDWGGGSADFIFMGAGIFLGPATTQNLVVKFDGEICGGVLVENASDDFPPAKEARKSPSKLRQKFATNFAENFANFTLGIAGP